MQQSASFGDQLRHFRELAGLTQEQLAEQSGLTPNAVGALERGERQRPYPRTVAETMPQPRCFIPKVWLCGGKSTTDGAPPWRLIIWQ